MLKLFRNKEVKIYLLVLLILNLFTTFFMYRSMSKATDNLYQAVTRERVALLGTILGEHPELESIIVPFTTENATKEQLEFGLEIARAYGLDLNTPIEGSQMLSQYQLQRNKNIFTYGTLILLLNCTIAFIILSHIYKKLRSFSEYAESIVEGDFETIKENQEEGDFAKLTLQYNYMAKRLQGSLENLNQEKLYLKNIVSDISHQLKTPLSSIKMFNELLIDGELEDINTATQFLTKSQNQIERMEWLIKNLLKMARLETNSVEFKNKSLSVYKTVKKTIEPLKKEWENKRQVVSIESTDEHILNHDPDWLGEAISNIVKNAIEHTPTSGKILITLTETPLAVKVQIDNDGEPIPQEDIPHIFQRFYKGRNNPRDNSTGIGLALAKAIVDNQNGSIEVRNNQRGPSFIIYLYKRESF